MIRINLLPHREMRRKMRRQAFVALLTLAACIGVVVIMGGAGIFSGLISAQEQRHHFLKAENSKLDEQIKEIAQLRQEIDGLKARQQAVEDLQGDRNQPVFLLDELAKQVPEGVYLRAFKQDGQRIVLNGYAQSNERVSELLRHFSNHSPWLERPDLIEIRSTGLGQGRDARKVFDFIVNVGIRRPRDKESATVSPAPVAALKSPETKEKQ